MTRQTEEEPTRGEVEHQLNRILRSDVFRQKPVLSKLLTYLVCQALDGIEVTGTIIAREVFDRVPALFENFVRSNANHLRTELNTYYRDSDDSIVVKLLGGRGYKPQFSYNTGSEAEQHYRRALHYFDKFPFGANWAVPDSWMAELSEAIGKEPTHARAHAALAYTTLIVFIFDGDPAHLIRCESSAKRALELNEKLWLAQTALGAIHSCRYEWDLAEQAFGLAMGIDPVETQQNPWYLAFLAAVGRTKEALALARGGVDRQPLSPGRRVMLGLLYLVAGHRSAAWNAIDEAYKSDTNYWPAWVLHHASMIGAEPKHWEDVDEADAEDEFLHLSLWYFPGIKHLTFVYPTKKRLENLETDASARNSKGTYWDLGLSYLGRHDFDNAIKAFTKAMDENHPFAMWLHLWPIFERLRDHPGYRELVRRMKVPERAA